MSKLAPYWCVQLRSLNPRKSHPGMKQLPVLQVVMHKKANFHLCGEVGMFILTTYQVQIQAYSVMFQNWFGHRSAEKDICVWLARFSTQYFWPFWNRQLGQFWAILCYKWQKAEQSCILRCWFSVGGAVLPHFPLHWRSCVSKMLLNGASNFT